MMSSTGERKPRDLPRVDERDTVFARMAREPGTLAYAEYYGRNPGHEAADNRLRAMPPLLEPGGLHYDPTICGEAADFAAAVHEVKPDPEAAAIWGKRLKAAVDQSGTSRSMLRALGAAAAGIAVVDDSCVYTHKGRHDSDYGRPINADLPRALVFLVEMDRHAMDHAPLAPVVRESTWQYLRAARIAVTAAEALRRAGAVARPHYDAHYEVILPPLAVAAGLGELGRNNILIADRFGSRVRIGAVTTDLDLVPDAPVSLGVDRFCRVCRKCAHNCPSNALSSDDSPPQEAGRWQTATSRCYGYWRAVGTDCGICMACCPFSHADTWSHRLVRRVVRRAPPWTHRLLVFLDDLAYGRTWRPVTERSFVRRLIRRR